VRALGKRQTGKGRPTPFCESFIFSVGKKKNKTYATPLCCAPHKKTAKGRPALAAARAVAEFMPAPASAKKSSLQKRLISAPVRAIGLWIGKESLDDRAPPPPCPSVLSWTLVLFFSFFIKIGTKRRRKRAN
jgi:hypothetical protein